MVFRSISSVPRFPKSVKVVILFSCPSTFPLFHEMIIFLLRNSKGDWSLINPLVHTVSTLVGYSFSHEVKWIVDGYKKDAEPNFIVSQGSGIPY